MKGPVLQGAQGAELPRGAKAARGPGHVAQEIGLEAGVVGATGARRSERLGPEQRNHNPRVGGSSPSSATKFHIYNQSLTPYFPPDISLASRSGVPFWVPERSARVRNSPRLS